MDVQRLVEQQAGQLAELTQKRDRLERRAEQLAEAFDTHKSTVTAAREAQAAHVRAVEDRAHTEIDRSREETKALQGMLRQKEREALVVASRLETTEASARTAERLAAEHQARATTLEQQLARMDGLPAALLVAQQALEGAAQREALLRAALDGAAAQAKIKTARGKKPKAMSAPRPA